MRNLTQDNITQEIIARLDRTPDLRLRELMTSLVQHLHAFARDVRLTEPEWRAGVRFLAEAGRRGAGAELEALSDTLGLTMLALSMHNAKPPDCNEIAEEEPGLVRGRVLGAAGEAVPGAVVDVTPAGSARSGPDGRFRFRCKPEARAPLPADGPVALLSRATGRRAWRPAHLRFTIRADGYLPLVSDVFRSDDGTGALQLEYGFVLTPTAKESP